MDKEKRVEASMQKLALIIAAGIVCLFISAHFVLATDIQPHAGSDWVEF